jgi:Icc protein
MSLHDVFSFIHLSDTHVPETRGQVVNGVQPYLKLEDTLDSINQLEVKPNFALITGDLVGDGEVNEYRLLKQYTQKLEESGIQALLALGNHDNRDNYREVFKTEVEDDHVYYLREFNGLRVVVLDSLEYGRNAGSLGKDQIKWLKNVIQTNLSQPTIIALHHPLFKHWLVELETIFNPAERELVYQIIYGSNVLGIFNGHLHHNFSTFYNGVFHSQAGSTYAELIYNDKEYWTVNSLSYNQIIYENKILYVKNISLPYDRRKLSSGPIQNLV